jgi:hypothetical protein
MTTVLDKEQEKFDDLIKRAARREAQFMLKEANRSDEDEDMSERLNGHYNFKIKKRLTLPLGAIIGAVLTFSGHAILDNIRQGDQLQQQSKLVDELKVQVVSKEVFEATIRPINANITEIKNSLAALQKLRQDEAQDQVIHTVYRTRIVEKGK